jgi:hypothetical protein
MKPDRKVLICGLRVVKISSGSSCGVQTINDNELNLLEHILQHLAISVNGQQIEEWPLDSPYSYNNLQNN